MKIFSKFYKIKINFLFLIFGEKIQKSFFECFTFYFFFIFKTTHQRIKSIVFECYWAKHIKQRYAFFLKIFDLWKKNKKKTNDWRRERKILSVWPFPYAIIIIVIFYLTKVFDILFQWNYYEFIFFYKYTRLHLLTFTNFEIITFVMI